MSEDVPLGQLFTRVYVERGAPTRDSERLRTRLSAYAYRRIDNDDAYRVVSMNDTELGIRLDSRELSGHFEQCSLQDLLNSITCTFRALTREYSRANIDWHSFVTRCLKRKTLDTDWIVAVAYTPQ